MNTYETIKKHAVQKAVFEINLRHVFYIVLGIVPMNLFHIVFFMVKRAEPESLEFLWRSGIIYSHASLLVISLILGGLGLSYRMRNKPVSRHMQTFIIVYAILLHLITIGIVSFDQIVTSAITPYIIVCVATALIFRLEPKVSVALYAGSLLIYVFAIALTQTDAAALMSNRVNGFTVVLLGLVLSIMLWRGTVRNIKNEAIIRKQREDLEVRNKELTEQSLKLAHAIAARDKFFSIIGHDLKSPFNSLMGFSEILLDDWDETDDDEKRQIIHLMKETSETTYQLLLNLLDWARIQKEQLQVRPELISLREITESVLSQLNAQATLKGVSVVIQIEAKLQARADEHMLKSIVRNLISNAIKYSARQSPITISASIVNDNLLYCVKDQGIGISKEDLSDVLQLDKVQSTEGTAREKGTGLGLQLCKEFVRMHQGKLWAESEPGQGATFCVSIPQN